VVNDSAGAIDNLLASRRKSSAELCIVTGYSVFFTPHAKIRSKQTVFREHISTERTVRSQRREIDQLYVIAQIEINYGLLVFHHEPARFRVMPQGQDSSRHRRTIVIIERLFQAREPSGMEQNIIVREGYDRGVGGHDSAVKRDRPSLLFLE
jgi:hypothetical protein